MRDIKFRAWDTNKKRWAYSTEINIEGSGQVIHNHYKWGRHSEDRRIGCGHLGSLQQYTGLKDKNGVEIYEGDIVGKSTKSGYNKQTIVWNNDSAGWDWETTTNDDWPDGFSGFIDEYEVIGNIYENPELLEAPHEN